MLEAYILQTNPPKVIFTTAYSEHALESYELNAVDYLLKPFSPERFAKAIEEAKAVIGNTGNRQKEISDERFIVVGLYEDCDR